MPRPPRYPDIPEWQQDARDLWQKGNSRAKIQAIIHDEYPNLYLSDIAEFLRGIKENRPPAKPRVRPMYTCPKCGSVTVRVLDTNAECDFILRMRNCECGYKWNTVELDLDMYNSIIGKGASYGNKV